MFDLFFFGFPRCRSPRSRAAPPRRPRRRRRPGRVPGDAAGGRGPRRPPETAEGVGWCEAKRCKTANCVVICGRAQEERKRKQELQEGMTQKHC